MATHPRHLQNVPNRQFQGGGAAKWCDLPNFKTTPLKHFILLRLGCVGSCSDLFNFFSRYINSACDQKIDSNDSLGSPYIIGVWFKMTSSIQPHNRWEIKFQKMVCIEVFLAMLNTCAPSYQFDSSEILCIVDSNLLLINLWFIMDCWIRKQVIQV